MLESPTTSWSAIASASTGDTDAREDFANRYAPMIRAYFAARWGRSARLQDLDDALQEVFWECIRPGGALERADEVSGGFRAFLRGVMRHVAARFEERAAKFRQREGSAQGSPASSDDGPVRAFERAWAEFVVREAAALMASTSRGDFEQERLHAVLAERFGKGRPLRRLADEWGLDSVRIHALYARARRRFYECLRLVLRDQAGTHPSDIDDECRSLMSCLSRA